MGGPMFDLVQYGDAVALEQGDRLVSYRELDELSRRIADPCASRTVAFVLCTNSVASIESRAFKKCYNLTSANIPDQLTSIENEVFSDCHKLTSVNIPDSVTKIGMHAFYNCSNLESVTIPDSVSSIGDNAFHNVQHIYYHGDAAGAPWGAKSIN